MLLLTLGLATFLQIAPPPPLPAPVPPPVLRNEIIVQAPPPDPQAIADASVESSKAILMGVVAPPPVQWVNELLNMPDIYRTTPASLTYENPVVRSISDGLRVVAFALLALAIFVVGMTRALGEDASLGRIAFAAALSGGSLVWWELGIRLNNVLCAGIGAPDLPSMIRPHLEMVINPTEAVGSTVLVIVYSIVALMLLFSLLFRLGLLMVLIAIGPLALLMYAAPQTEHFASHYVRLTTGYLYGQVLIVLGLRLVGELGAIGTGLGGTLFSIVIMLLLRQLPAMLASSGQQRQGNRWGTMLFLALRRRLPF